MCFIFYLPLQAQDQSGCSAVGSALRSGRRGRQFESGHPDKLGNKGLNVSSLFVVEGKEVGEKSVNFELD